MLALPAWLLWPALAPATAASDISTCTGVYTRTLTAGPNNYRSLLSGLQAGDRLQLTDGTYPEGLPLSGVRGLPGQCIAIEGPESGLPAVFPGRDCCNTVSLRNVAYLEIRNLTLDGDGRWGDGVKLEGNSQFGHHVVLENLLIIDHDASQQVVGISTKAPAWNWVIRRNLILNAGTGIYLGDSDGSAEFVNGLIELNHIGETQGYNLQIKRQYSRATGLDDATMPENGSTVVRYNSFDKSGGSSTDPALFRPNMLVGHWPLSGPGSDDDYLIYGNLFHVNDTGVEGLLQATGNVIIYDNLFYNPGGPGLLLQPHNGVAPGRVRVFHNTVVARDQGIRLLSPSPDHTQHIVGNAAFAGSPIGGDLAGVTVVDNVTDDFLAADQYLVDPFPDTGHPDLHALSEPLVDSPIQFTDFAIYLDHDRDFDCRPRDGRYYGAYAGPDEGTGWTLLDPVPRPPPCISWGIFQDGFETVPGGNG